MPVTEDDLDDLLTRSAAANILHVHISTLDKMIHERDLESIRIGAGRGRVYVTRRALLDYLNRGVRKVERKDAKRAAS